MPHLPIPSKQRTTTKRLPTGRQDVYNSSWEKTSRLYRIANPLCELCKLQDILTDATPGNRKGVTDHVVRLTLGGALLDERNLCTLCRKCHNRKSAYELRGWGTPAITTTEGLVPINKIEALKTLIPAGDDSE